MSTDSKTNQICHSLYQSLNSSLSLHFRSEKIWLRVWKELTLRRLKVWLAPTVVGRHSKSVVRWEKVKQKESKKQHKSGYDRFVVLAWIEMISELFYSFVWLGLVNVCCEVVQIQKWAALFSHVDHDYKSHWNDTMGQIIEAEVISNVGVHDAVNSFRLHFANTWYIFVCQATICRIWPVITQWACY